ncbi:MAG: sigma-54 dependent transcriptional regulator [Gemmatimonadota bacterium]|nr:sigma-54 dependent transcriptional regulator [Gemmatimonadota bacterium]MDH3368716.1 sigma-54 dependent transcriptional regulator [Gemmatimonadota bacterium]MDH3477659.1 sigma-54 dependent transcriptional regulator [Gemmatimonadota bacterium]MDH3568574.1 sigma-54 dependent transcriptional regulator [Gemmatimonadota bacterium]
MTTRKILIVDDELSVRGSLEEWFREDGFHVETAEDGNRAIAKMEAGPYDIVLLDLKMPGMDGITVQRRVREIDPGAAIIILTAYASVETAVEALKLGAFDYITKPVDPDDLSNLVRNALRQKELAEENLRLKEKVSELIQSAPIIGGSPKMRRVLDTIRTVAETDSTVVIRGESGTGKELVARSIHAQSKRRFFPIVAVNAGSIPETLLESELFGHEKGAFTGAQYRRKGKIELAHGGTLFLDEIGDVTPKMQIDLLRVLETKRFTRLGGNQEVSSDFRLVCATHKNLEQMVSEGAFREDLYYRINVFGIEVPPLRERPEDILELARFFVEKYARAMGKPLRSIAPAAEEVLVRYRWPGNVRELENAIERAMVIGQGPAIEPGDLPLHIESGGGTEPAARSLAAVEKEHIERVLQEFDGNVTRAAKTLGIDRATLYNKLKRYGIRR